MTDDFDSNPHYDPQRNRFIEGVCEQIIKEGHALHFDMQEAQFIRECLPILAGEETNLDLTFWSFNVGHYRPIHVYKGTEFLFEVPPLFHRRGFVPRQSDRDSVSEEMESALRRGQNNPNDGIRMVRKALESRVLDKDPTVVIQYAAAINSILERYGKPKLPTRTTIEGKAVVETPKSQVYDQDGLNEGALD